MLSKTENKTENQNMTNDGTNDDSSAAAMVRELLLSRHGLV